MRDALKNAVQSAILFECQLPHQETGIDKSCLSSQNDICFKHSSPQDVAKVIYNGIVEFAVNESIKKCIDYIAAEYTRIGVNIPAAFDYRLFFIFLPLSEVRQIKESVIRWINLFNCGALICLFSTTTITEGVNTSAKNIFAFQLPTPCSCLENINFLTIPQYLLIRYAHARLLFTLQPGVVLRVFQRSCILGMTLPTIRAASCCIRLVECV